MKTTSRTVAPGTQIDLFQGKAAMREQEDKKDEKFGTKFSQQIMFSTKSHIEPCSALMVCTWCLGP